MNIHLLFDSLSARFPSSRVGERDFESDETPADRALVTVVLHWHAPRLEHEGRAAEQFMQIDSEMWPLLHIMAAAATGLEHKTCGCCSKRSIVQQ